MKELYDDLVDYQNSRNLEIEVMSSDLQSMSGEEVLQKIPSGTRFSMEAPVEQTKDLIAVHNVMPYNLLADLEIGGLASPSIAVVKAAMEYNNFGTISLVFDKDSIDPKADKRNKVFGADVYSARFPEVEYKINDKKAAAIERKTEAAIPAEERKAIGSPDVLPFVISKKAREYNGDWGKAYQRDEPLMYAFLAERGTPPELKYKTTEYTMYFSNDAVALAADAVSDVIDDLVEEPNKYFKDKAFLEKLEQVVGTQFRKEHEEWKDSNLRTLQNAYNEPRIKDFGRFISLVDGIDKYHRLGLSKEVDRAALFDAIRKKMGERDVEQPRTYGELNDIVKEKNLGIFVKQNPGTGYNLFKDGKFTEFVNLEEAGEYITNRAYGQGLYGEYAEWLQKLFDGVIEKKGLRNNKDYMTDSGNRRSWESLHEDYSVEGAVKIMTSGKIKGAEGIWSDSAIFGMMAAEYADIDAIRRDSGRLKRIDDDEYRRMREQYLNEYDAIIREYDPDILSGREATIKAIMKYKTAPSLEKALRAQYGAKVKQGTGKRLVDLRNRMAAIPVSYFEAKPQRAIYFDEVKYAVVPEGTDEKILEGLRNYGIPYHEYADQAERAAIVSGLNELRFSRFIPDPATEELDIDTLDDFLDRATDGTYAIFKKDDGSYKVYGGSSLPSIQVSSIKEAQDWINQNVTPLDLLSLRDNWADKPVSKEALRGLVRLEASDLALNMLVGGRPILEGLNFEPVRFETIEDAKKYLIDHAEEIRSKYHRRTKLASRMRVLGEDDYTEEFKASRKYRDSEDNLLSKGQQKYFADSKIRDDKGRLIVMYHGTQQTGFTVFDPQFSDDKISLFFTDNPGVAASYSGGSSHKTFTPETELEFKELQALAASAGMKLSSRDYEAFNYGLENVNAWLKTLGEYEIREEEPNVEEESEFEEDAFFYAYKNGKRMEDITAHQDIQDVVEQLEKKLGAQFRAMDYSLTGDDAPAYVLSWNDGSRIGTYENLYDAQEEIFSHNPKNGRGLYKVYVKAVNPLIIDAKGRNWNNIEFEGKRWKTRELSRIAKVRGYDGVFFQNIIDIGGFGIRGGKEESNIAIVFQGNQAKSVDNKIPTDHPDTRHSRNVETFENLETIVTRGTDWDPNYWFSNIGGKYELHTPNGTHEFRTLQEAQKYISKNIAATNIGELKDNRIESPDLLYYLLDQENSGWKFWDLGEQVYEILQPNGTSTEWRSLAQAQAYIKGHAAQINPAYANQGGDVGEDSEGNALTKNQQNYFKNSKVRDENGNLLVLYHGSEEAGFTVFDPTKSDDEISLFFTDSIEVAMSYSDTDELYIPDREMPFDKLSELAEEFDATIYEDGDGYVIETIGEEPKRFKNLKELQQHIIDGYALADAGNYQVYVNLENPLIVNANGNKWNKLDDIYEAVDVEERQYLTTRDYAQIAKDEGYDGVIFRDIVDIGEYGDNYVTSTVVIAFDGNQVKSTANKNPTKHPDMRKSIDLSGIDDFEDGSIESIYRDQELASILRQGSEALKGQKVDSKLVNKIAGEILKKYKSAYDRKTLADNLEKLFAYAQEKNRIDYEDLSKVIREVARPVVDSVTEKVGTKEYKAFMDILRSRKIALTDRQKAEVASHSGSYGAFVKSMRGISFSSKGTPLDSMWSELVDASGGFLDPDAAEGDMPILLQQAMHDLTPYAANTFQGDADDVAANLAMEIIERYYEEAGKAQSDATLKQKLKEASDKMKKEAEEFRQTVRREYEERLKEARKEQKERSDRKRREGKYTQKDMDEAIAKMRARNKRQYEKQKEAEQQRYQKQQVMNAANKLLNMLINPTPKAHVPEALQEPVLDLLTSINFLTPTITRTKDGKYQTKILVTEKDETGKVKRRWETFIADNVADVIGAFQESLENTANGSKDQRKWNEKLRGVKDLYSQAVTPNSELSFTLRDFLEGLDQSLAADLDAIIANRNGAVAISMLNAEELKTINKVIRNIMASINKIDKLYSDPESINGVHGLAEQTMAHANSLLKNRKMKDRRRATRGVKTSLTLDNATPETFMHAIGESGERIYRMLTKAQNTKAFDLRQAQEYMIGDGSTDKDGRYNSGILKGVSQKELSEWSGDKAKIVYDGGNMKLTVADLMYLYELQKRKDAESHKYGGFEAADKIINGKVHQDTTPHYMSSETISEITDLLTERQKEIADDMQKFLAVECSAWGNDVSMLLYGYEKFTDPNYIPMSVDKRTTRISNEQVGEGLINTIKNQGFTKALIPNASNPLIIMDIFDVFTNHVTGMAAYHAYAAPITDIIRWDNFKAIDEIEGFDGEKYGRYNTVKESLQTIFGDDGQTYLVRLVQDLNNQERRTEVGASRVQWLMGNYKSAATLANLRVVMQQPTAWLRAGEVIDYKWLAEGLKPNAAAADLQERTSAISWVKSQGNIDGYITQSMKATITGAQTWRDRINGAAGYLAGKADDVTWAALYRAVYAEQKAAHDGKTNTVDFELAVNRRFDELIARTQVVDGTLMRSQMMRSKDGLNTTLSAFMAEPTKSYNMFLRDYFDIVQGRDKTGKVRKEDLKHLSRTLVAFLLTNIVNAVAQSLADAARDEKEDKDYWDKFLEAYTENLLDDLNMLHNIPVVKNLTETVEAGIKRAFFNETPYNSGTDDMLFGGLSTLLQSIGAAKQYNEKSKKTPYGVSAEIIKGISQVFGVPAYNLMRDVVAIYNTVNDFWGGKNIRRTKATTAELTGNAMETIENSIRTGSDYKAAIEESVKRGATYDQIERKITETYKPEYLGLLEQGKKSEATTLENRLIMIYQYLDKQEGQKKSDKNRVRKWAE